MKIYRKNTKKKSKLRGAFGALQPGIKNLASQPASQPELSQLAGIDSPAEAVQMVRWGTPLNENPNNMHGFEIPSNLINNKEGEEWYYELPSREELEDNQQQAVIIKNKIVSVINNTLMVMLKELKELPEMSDININNQRSISFFNSPNMQNIIVEKLWPRRRRASGDRIATYSMEFDPPDREIDPVYNFGAYHLDTPANPVTLVCIFCSMIRIMVDFIKSGKEYLVWIQRKGDIVDKEKFIQLVEECKQFDVTWLWASMQHVSRGRRPDMDKVLARTQLSYSQKNEAGPYSPTFTNNSIMMKRNIAIRCIKLLLNSGRGSRTNLIKEDVTLQRWVNEITKNVCVIYEQGGHPIQYIDAESSYRTG